ncbi:glycosyltransferase family 4 protein [Alcanivorax sp.]|jgi:glycosyltransferase involved in cell wall biosynthesis|uniref:glycosyltransferase family 4 protein n=1 Tax=Alcanivorax sp. TaxID=1872427 RepID=UPI0032D8BE4C
MVLNVISSLSGGGAELLVRELHKLYENKGVKTKALYFSGKSADKNNGEHVIGVGPKNPLAIFYIRKWIIRLSAESNDVLTVHAHLTWPFFYVALASLGINNVRLIYTEHNTTNKRRQVPFLRLLERFIYGRYSKIICISPAVKESLIDWIGDRFLPRVVTVTNGAPIYDLYHRPPVPGRRVRLVSVGSLTEKKNFSVAIKAVAKIPEIIEVYKIIGEGPERKKLEHLIKCEGVEGKVVLVGWSDYIEEHLKEADIQLIPSLWEGFGLVAVEGMSTGISIVASDVPGLRDVLDPNNMAVTLVKDVGNVSCWVDGIVSSADDFRLYNVADISFSAHSQAEKFSLEEMAEKYLDVYRCESSE